MTKLSDLQIDEVSLVRKGANQHAHVAIAKAYDGDTGGTVDEEFYVDADGDPVDVTDLEIGDIVFDGETGEAFQYTEADESEDGAYEDDLELVGKALKVNGRTVTGPARSAILGGRNVTRRVTGGIRSAGDATRKAGRNAAISGASLADSARNSRVGTGLSTGAGAVKAGTGNVYGAAKRQGIRAAGATEGFLRTQVGGVDTRGRIGALALGGAGAGAAGGYGAGRVRKSYQESMAVELSKALTDDDRDQVIAKYAGVMDELMDQVSKAQEIAEQEREARLESEFLEVAKSYTLPVSDEDLADALRACAEMLDEGQVEVIRKCLEVASDAMEAEFGATGGGDNGDVMNRVSAQVSRFAKSHDDEAGLVTKAFEMDPAGYDEYLMDNPAQLGR